MKMQSLFQRKNYWLLNPIYRKKTIPICSSISKIKQKNYRNKKIKNIEKKRLFYKIHSLRKKYVGHDLSEKCICNNGTFAQICSL